MEQDRSAYCSRRFGRKPLDECRTLLQLLQSIRHIYSTALELDRSRDQLPTALKHEDNEVASLALLLMSIESAVCIHDNTVAGNILEGYPASIPRAGYATVLRAYVRADTGQSFLHSRVLPAVASASRFCNSAERL